jgi:LysM repeat protein
MGSNLPNLVDTIRKNLPMDFAGKMSSMLGENREKANLGIGSAIPSLLGGLGEAASTPDGARRLSSAVDDADEGILGNVGKMFGQSASISQGSTILRSLLGAGSLSQITGSIGKLSGLTGSSVTSMLGMLAPIILGVLKREKISRGLDSAGLANLLAGQRDHIAAAMPGYEKETVVEHPALHKVETFTAENAAVPVREHRPSTSWVLPLVLLAGIAGLFWYLSSRHAPATTQAYNEERTPAAPAVTCKTDTASFTRLRAKYMSVIDLARKEGVQISDLCEENGKLLIKGQAPSLEAANNIWDEIKKVNPDQNDIVADFPIKASSLFGAPAPGSRMKPSVSNVPSVEEPSATVPSATVPSATAPGPMNTSGLVNGLYTVRPGDTLSSISQKFYGNRADYIRIFNANRSQLANSDLIHAGEQLKIPAK